MSVQLKLSEFEVCIFDLLGTLDQAGGPEVLRQMHLRGIRTLVCSSSPKFVVQKDLTRLNLASLIAEEDIVHSAYKGSTRIFAKLKEALQVPAERIVFFDDDPSHCSVAAALKIKAVWIVPQPLREEEYEEALRRHPRLSGAVCSWKDLELL